MSSTSFTRATTTAPDLLSLTTPFVQPSKCDSYWYLTSGPFSDYAFYPTVSLLVSGSGDKRFSSCQPSGWDSVASEDRFSFSPGVCPSKWVYNDMAEAVSTTNNSLLATYSTAFCCASGFSLWRESKFPITTMSKPCVREFLDNQTTLVGTLSHGEGSTQLFSSGFQVHDAWQISWVAADRSTLTPSLPTLTSSRLVPEWNPGRKLRPGEYTPGGIEESDMGNWQPLLNFIMIGVPIIGVTVIALSVWCCIWCRREKRKERERIEAIVRNVDADTAK